MAVGAVSDVDVTARFSLVSACQHIGAGRLHAARHLVWEGGSETIPRPYHGDTRLLELDWTSISNYCLSTVITPSPVLLRLCNPMSASRTSGPLASTARQAML